MRHVRGVEEGALGGLPGDDGVVCGVTEEGVASHGVWEQGAVAGVMAWACRRVSVAGA